MLHRSNPTHCKLVYTRQFYSVACASSAARFSSLCPNSLKRSTLLPACLGALGANWKQGGGADSRRFYPGFTLSVRDKQKAVTTPLPQINIVNNLSTPHSKQVHLCMTPVLSRINIKLLDRFKSCSR